MENNQRNHKLISYHGKGYLDKDRWVSYFWQTKLIKQLISSGDILEIGVGNKVVSRFLEESYNVKTVDINMDLKPDIVASVENLGVLSRDQFDLVLCAEVLEHLPFNKFRKSLLELSRVTKKYIILSLPYWGYTFGFKVRLPFLGKKVFKFKLSGIKSHNLGGEHFWEIGKKWYPLKKIKNEIKSAGLNISKSFWDLDDPYHYYFILEK